MLRSILTNPTIRRLNPHHHRPYKAASMSEILTLLGPFDKLFPSPQSTLYKRLVSKCIQSNNISIGSSVHCRLIQSGYHHNILVSNVLLHMYAKLGFIENAIMLFDEMPHRDMISWCTVISGFVNNGLEIESWMLFKRMIKSGVVPNCFVVSSVLKGCSAAGVLELGISVHGMVVKCGVGFDQFVEIGLVDMYGKCGCLDVAVKMFYEIPVKGTVGWNAMISGYVQGGWYKEAVELCLEMCRAGVRMDLVTVRVVASAASALEMIDFCRNFHGYCIKVGLDGDSFMVVELVRLLSKVGEVEDMRMLFERVKRPDASLCSLLISGYHLHGYREEAVKLAQELLYSNLELKEGAIVSVLNLCLGSEEGGQMHARVCKTGHISYLSISNALIAMYIRFEEMMDADTVFLTMPVRDVISWTTIMAGLVQDLRFGEALENFHALRETGIPPDQHSVATAVNACAGIQSIVKGSQIHGLALKHGFTFSDFLNASLLNMYAKCGFIETASRLFSLVPSHDLVLVNVMLAGYSWNSEPDKALELFGREYTAGFVPDHFSYSTVLSACTETRSLAIGEQIHCRISKSGFESSDLILGNAIVNMYVKSGSITSACRFFYSMRKHNVNTYAMLMLGYIQNRGSNRALELFYEMQQRGLRANPVAFARILRGCAVLSEIVLGKQVHAYIIKLGLVSDAYVGNALVGMYAKTRHGLERSGMDMTIDRPCDSMNTGSSQLREEDRNLKAFGLFRLEGVHEDCSSYPVSSHYTGVQDKSIVPHVVQSDTCLDVSVGSTVAGKKRKYNSTKNLRTVLHRMPFSEVVTWNSMISQYVEHGWENMEWFKTTSKQELTHEYIIYLAVFPAICSDLIDERTSSSKPASLSLFPKYRKELCLYGG